MTKSVAWLMMAAFLLGGCFEGSDLDSLSASSIDDEAGSAGSGGRGSDAERSGSSQSSQDKEEEFDEGDKGDEGGFFGGGRDEPVPDKDDAPLPDKDDAPLPDKDDEKSGEPVEDPVVGQECSACVQSDCQPALLRCIGERSCGCAIECIGAGKEPQDCLDGCGLRQVPPTLEAVFDCAADSCADAC